MSVKNSAGVKLNDATELIIVADPDGTVESCFNLSNNTEYVGASFDIVNASVSINNQRASSISLYYPLATDIVEGYIRAGYASINSGSTGNYNVLVNGTIQLGSGQYWEVVSGDAEIVEGTTNRLIQIKGACSLAVH